MHRILKVNYRSYTHYSDFLRDEHVFLYHVSIIILRILSPVMYNSYFMLTYRLWYQCINGTHIFRPIMLSGKTWFSWTASIHHLLRIKSTPPYWMHWNTHCTHHYRFDRNLSKMTRWLVITGTCSSLFIYSTCLEAMLSRLPQVNRWVIRMLQCLPIPYTQQAVPNLQYAI
jgi:hypothetical protein